MLLKKLKYIASQLKELFLLALIALASVAAIYVTIIILNQPSIFSSQKPLFSSTTRYHYGGYKGYNGFYKSDDEGYKRRVPSKIL